MIAYHNQLSSYARVCHENVGPEPKVVPSDQFWLAIIGPSWRKVDRAECKTSPRVRDLWKVEKSVRKRWRRPSGISRRPRKLEILCRMSTHAYLTENRYPPHCNQAGKRVIRRKAGKFSIRDGELFFLKQKKNARKGNKALNPKPETLNPKP